MSFAFKKFNFLQHTEVPVHAYPRNATSCAPSPKHLYVGCDNGVVQVLDQNFQLLTTFQAHAFRVFHLAYLEERRLLLSVGSEEPGYSSTTIKLWDLPNILATRAAAGASIANLTPPQQPVKMVKAFTPKHPEGEITAVSSLEILPPPVPTGAAAIPGTLMADWSAGVGPAAAHAAQATGAVLAVAVGLATGLVYVLLLDLPGTGGEAVKGASGSLKTPNAPIIAAKPISVTKLSARPEAGHTWAVMGLALHGANLDTLALFVVTESQTLSFNLKTNTKSVLDAQGVPHSHCTVLRSAKQQYARALPRIGALADEGQDQDAMTSRAMQPMLMVARDEGLYNFTPDTRAGCTVLEGSKQQLVLLGRFVVVVTQEKTEVGMSSATLLIIDLAHKLISGSLTLQSVSAVVAWSFEPAPGPTAAATAPGAVKAGGTGAPALQRPMLVVVTGGNKLYTFREVPLSMQLESLFKRSLHKLAFDLARVHNADAATIATIQQRWGDALYSKGEYDAAMTQYCDTIGHLEPSYVIRRFLDAQRIHNLTSYLELLHDKGIAGADHTTLLLNCYTKLKDVDKLDAFVQTSVVGVGEGNGPGSGTGSPHHPTTGSRSSSPNTAAARRKGAGASRLGQEPGAAPGTAGGEAAGKKAGKKKGRKGSVASIEDLKAAGKEGGEASGGATGLASNGKKAELKFDAETAVKVLRAAGYPRHALVVARAAGQADWELDILTEDLAAWDEALTVMERLPRAACAAALRRVGKVLVTSRPERTTGLIMDLCAPSLSAGGDGYAGSVADFAHLFCDAPTGLMLLCEFILNTAPVGTITDERMLYHTLLELYLTDTLEDGRSSGGRATPTPSPSKSAAASGAPSASHPKSTPAGAQSAAAQPAAPQSTAPQSTAPHSTTPQSTAPQSTAPQSTAPQSTAPQSTAPQSTALETQPPAGQAGMPQAVEDPAVVAERKERRAKALALLQSGWPPHLEQPKYDQEHALVLCRLAGFKEGLVILYDKLRLYREVMQVYMVAGDHASLLAAVLRYGDVTRGGDPHLWVLLLEYLAQQSTDDIEQRVVEVVDYIEARNILPPIMVLQLLATNTKLQVRSLRGYVARQLSREVSEASRDREAATRLAADTAQLRAELARLKSQARVFQASRCSATGQPLELPAIHFLCGHAYNARALGDNDKECPLCAPDYRRVVEIRRNMAASALQQDRFFTELRESGNGFSVVADHFGRGLMNMTAGALSQQGLEGQGGMPLALAGLATP